MSESDDISGRVRLRELKTLSDNHYTLRKAMFDFQRRDGAWQHQARESYDIGDAATVLPMDRARDRVLLIRQFRWQRLVIAEPRFLFPPDLLAEFRREITDADFLMRPRRPSNGAASSC